MDKELLVESECQREDCIYRGEQQLLEDAGLPRGVALHLLDGEPWALFELEDGSVVQINDLYGIDFPEVKE